MTDSASPPIRKTYLKDLILLFAVPIGIAALSAAIIYIPKSMAHPKYDFVYSICESYSCRDSYYVKDGVVARNIDDLTSYHFYDRSATLRYYDVSRDSSRTITPNDIRRYHLDDATKSPDGYTLTKPDISNGGFFGSGSYDYNWYLVNGLKKKKIQISPTNSYSTADVTFLGWVQP